MLPPQIINELKTEYVSIGNEIKNIFNSNTENVDYYVEYMYSGYNTQDMKCSPKGENTQFVLTNKLSGKVTVVTNLFELVECGIYSRENLMSIWTKLIKLTAIEKTINEILEKTSQKTEVYYGRELSVQIHSISSILNTCVY